MLDQLTKSSLKLKRVFIEPQLPKALAPLAELAQNLWWSWHHDAISLFKGIDPALFISLDYNPVALLDNLPSAKSDALLKDKDFLAKMKQVHTDFKVYIAEKPAKKNTPQIAYFCMEYGLHQSLRLYSGGLGVLAGDYVKEASDRNANFFAVGLLYRYGYFQQEISMHGEQLHHLDAAKFTQLPIEPVRTEKDDWLKVSVDMEDRTVWAKVWELKVGRVSLYLLDADISENKWEDRTLTHQLYGGDSEYRLKQEMLLGIGGMKAVAAMGHQPDVFHLNEGHAAFLGLERLRMYVKEGLAFSEAIEVVRSTQLFTTHTPVPAGHDAFFESLLKRYMHDRIHDLGISWEQLVALGKHEVENPNEQFSMSLLAIRTSQEVNGVSRLHGAVSREMFNNLYPEYYKDELFIGHVTNGVHFPTWVSYEWAELYRKVLGKSFIEKQSDPKTWEKIQKAKSADIIEVRKTLKKRLLDYVKATLTENMTRRGENPRNIFNITNNIQDEALVIGFARRFATYKRATLLFTNEDRLAEIVNNRDRPVIFLFAGKAHPADKGGQDLIRLIYNTSKNPRFQGKVIFLENYGMEMAKLLTQGVDVWLNNPTRPKEASGTSGMKAVMNGVLNFSVLDGWWCEGYRPDAGWALPEENTYADEKLQNELDAERIYGTLEAEIIPSFFADGTGYSEDWIRRIKNNCTHIIPQFTMTRMMEEYEAKFYGKLSKRSKTVQKAGFEASKSFSAWKNMMLRGWQGISVLHVEAPDTDNHALPQGVIFEAKITLNLNTIPSDYVGVEAVFFKRKTETELDLVQVIDMKPVDKEGTVVAFECSKKLAFSGVYEYGYRIYPKHAMMEHRQELPLAKWV